MPSKSSLLARIRTAPAPEGEPVLDSALSAFLDFGIKRSSMGEIARRAGISQATLYRRFESKNELIEAVAVREAQRLVTTVDAGMRSVTGAEAQLTEIFVAFINAMSTNALLSRLLRTEPEAVLPRLTVDGGPILAIGRAYLAEQLRTLRTGNATHDFDADLVAEIMARLALSLALTPDGLIPHDDPEAAREFARNTLLPMIGIPPA